MIRKRKTKNESWPSAYRSVSAIALQIVCDHSLLLIEYLWKHVSLIRGRRTKGGPFPFVYREVLEIALRRVGGNSPSLIDDL